MPTVLLSGASSGIGRATAERLGRAGWRVLAGARRDEDLEALARLPGTDRDDAFAKRGDPASHRR